MSCMSVHNTVQLLHACSKRPEAPDHGSHRQLLPWLSGSALVMGMS